MGVPGDVEVVLNRSPCVFGGVSADLDKAFAVVIGVPYDGTASYRGGARFAPCAVRGAAANIEFYSLRSRVDVERVPIHDLGDVAVSYSVEAVVDNTARVAAFIAGLGKLAVVLGGEHTVTLGVLRGLVRRGFSPCVVVADAHLDLRDEYMGYRLCHATVMRRVVEELGLPVAYVGVRAVSAEELDYARAKGIPFYTSYDVEREGADVVAAELSRYVSDAGCTHLYVSVDMDVLDPGYAPGVSNPEAEGLTPIQLLDVLTTVAGQAKLLGFDVVEVAPPYDHGGATAIAAAKVVVELVASAWASQRS